MVVYGLQSPVKLAQNILENQLPLDSIQNYLAQKDTKVVELEKGIPVNIIISNSMGRFIGANRVQGGCVWF